MRSSAELNAQIGHTVHIKDETIQLSGSFKFRGAILGVRNSIEGVVAAGAGNFPIAVGLAAKTLAKSARLIMPSDVPLFKLEQAKRTGADIELVHRSELIERAQIEARKLGWRNLHAFEDDEMIAGSYTLGLEIAVATAIDPTGDTSCDALRPRKIGARAFDILEQSSVRVYAVNDERVREASSLLHRFCGIRVEPSGAIALGAILGGIVGKEHDRIWAIACGGNVMPE